MVIIHRILIGFDEYEKKVSKGKSFVSPEGPKSQANKINGINIKTFILTFEEYCFKCDTIHDFSLWLRTSSNPADINQFQSHTGKKDKKKI